MSKIGPHDYSTTEWGSRAGIVKGFGTPEPLRQAHPDAWRIFRTYMGEWQPRDGADVAREVISGLQGYRHPKLSIELYVGPPQDRIADICTQIEQALPVCRAEGVGLAAFSFYTGQPEAGVWQYAANRGWCGLDPDRELISVQEYTSTGSVDDAVNVGRFRALINCGWKGRIAVTEAGYDSAGTPQSGWQSAMTLTAFYAYLQAYDGLLLDYPQVVGATVFNAPGWTTFDFHDPLKKFSIIPTDSQASEGAMDEATQTALIEMEAKQNGLLTDAIKALRTGQFQDLDTIYCALKGGLQAPDYTPSFP